MSSEKIEIKFENHRVFLIVDTLEGSESETLPIIILPPAYDKTVRDYFMFLSILLIMDLELFGSTI